MPASGGVPADGTMQNIGAGGCRVFSDTPPAVGDELSLQLHVPNFHVPLCIDRSIVRWLVGQEFGVEFLAVTERDQTALSSLLQQLETRPVPLAIATR